MTYGSDQIERLLHGHITAVSRQSGDPLPINSLLTDSRSLRTPEGTLFFALRTQTGDGHRYIEQLHQRGVRAFVVSDMPPQPHPDSLYLQVDDTLAALQCLCKAHRMRFDVPVVGVAGSNGKTTVKEWLFQLLATDRTVTRSPRSYNSQVGVPLSVWNLSAQTDVAIFEAGISRPGEMQRLRSIIRPTIGVFTCLGDAHQENFATMEEKCREKLSLFQDADVLVWAKGNPVVDKCIEGMGMRAHLAPVVLPKGASALEVNRELCLAVCRILGLDGEELSARAEALTPVAMRLEVKEGLRGCTIVNDSYNSDLSSLDIALDFVRRHRPNLSGRPLVLILSDIEQTGMEPSALYAQVAKMVAERGVTLFIGVGPQLMANARLFTALGGIECHFFHSTPELLATRTLALLHDATALVKGARSFRFESIVESLELRLHETILEVDLRAIASNLKHFRSQLSPAAGLVCMVKADAYGAGAREVARVREDNNVEYLAVATADEGVELRRAGISTGIIVMNPEMNCLPALFAHSLEPEVYSFRLLEALIRAGQREGITGFPVHIKVDTGMHRLGFSPTRDMPQLTSRLASQATLTPRSIFSHFAGSDSDDFDEFTLRQYSLFTSAADSLQAAFPAHRILRHICNTAAIARFPSMHHDLARLGLGLYGIDPATGHTLSNVSTLRTTILQIRDVPKGETVGYSRRWTATRDCRIAALPIGYADGLNRRLGNGHGHCIIAGKPAPYVGNICMDVSLADVTDIDCREGDHAVIFGEQLPPALMAEWLGTIPYEVLTSVSPRVKRVYFSS